MTHTAVICLGSNVGPRRSRIADAMRAMRAFVEMTAVSPANESDDVTGRGDAYVNRVCVCLTNLEKDEFANRLADIELAGGRTADRSRRGIVDIDIDLVVWDDIVEAPADFVQPYFRRLYEMTNKSSDCH